MIFAKWWSQAVRFCYNPEKWRDKMKVKYSGSIHFANGDPVSNVVVRVFDKDASGKGDDDLTVTPGLSDEQGRFSLIYEPLRYLDYHTIHLSGTTEQSINMQAEESELRIPDLGDVYLPYLWFNYTFNGLICEHTASLGVFQTKFYLPENPPVEFLPSMNGFRFLNSFSGYFLPFTTPAFMSSRKVSSKYGLCGGMCSAVYDFALAGKPIPPSSEVPKQGTRLQRYLFHRQIDSLGGLGHEVVKVAQWTSLPDDTLVGIERRTADEFNEIRRKLDNKNLVILALIYEHANTLKELSILIFNNHQVLAYAYRQDAAGRFTINIYDPNLPSRDDVVILSEPVVLGEMTSPTGSQTVLGLRSTELVGGKPYRDVRGFFAMPYLPVKPPTKL
jgi:hypothetical protein